MGFMIIKLTLLPDSSQVMMMVAVTLLILLMTPGQPCWFCQLRF